jgi:hypothetical protein
VQNNNRGGYNVGDKSATAATTGGSAPSTIYNEADTTSAIQYPLVYYEGSIVQIEWTNQHGCGGNSIDDPALQNCNIVLQYACDNTNTDPAMALALRDGTTTNQINTDGTTANEGIHESVEYYRECSTRSRNQGMPTLVAASALLPRFSHAVCVCVLAPLGLFTADQNLNGNTARFTRQNPNGDRSGLECAEERDYCKWRIAHAGMREGGARERARDREAEC